MHLSEWFAEQLKASGTGFVWAVEQLPPERRYVPHPRYPDEWPVARHVFHMLYYEQTVVLPYMEYWFRKPFASPFIPEYDEDAAWGDGHDHDLEQMLTQFREVRAAQIDLLPRISEAKWNEVRETVWGFVPLRWVVTKTYQHSCGHTHDVLRMVLFWDMVAGSIPAKGE